MPSGKPRPPRTKPQVNAVRLLADYSNLELMYEYDRVKDECDRRGLIWSEGGYFLRHAVVVDNVLESDGER